jgi:8-oxo-dGTP pyrophosphatase MutT (NUDIX family)
VLVVVDGRLALIDRVRPGSPGPYAVVPGGGVETNETPAQAAVREAKEELGLDVRLRSPEPAFLVRAPDHLEHYFLVDVVGGTLGTGSGPEWDPDRGRGTSTPVLVTPEEAARRDLVPIAVSETVLQAFVTGDWPADGTTLELNDPTAAAPWRVRAGGFCLDDDGCVTLLTGDQGDGVTFFEIPGGGVEAGETPEQAVVRELEEELGFHVRVERELAEVWKDGREEHYFLVRPTGSSGRTVLDHESFFTPVRVPAASLADLPVWPKRLGWRFADWWSTGRWPTRPLHLIDTIRDLRPPCRW